MPFVKGKSGNPKGKKKGNICTITPNTLKPYKAQFTEIACEKSHDLAPKIIEKALQMAIDGNEKMITMLWDKFFDVKLYNQLNKRLASKTAADIAESQGAVIEAAGSGEIDVDYALSLVKALAVKRDSIIFKDLEDYVNEHKAKEKNNE